MSLSASNCFDESQLWSDIFNSDKQLAMNLHKTCTSGDGTITLQSTVYGVINLVIKPATALGDNFTSDAFSAIARLEDGITHSSKAFIKVLPHNNIKFLGAVQQKLYHREIANYKHLHPLLRQLRVDDETLSLSVGQLFHSHLDQVGGVGHNSTVLVFQDLKSLGYRMADKRLGCTLQEARLTLSALAHYHALTMALLRRPNGNDITIPDELHFITQWPSFYLKAYDMAKMNVPHFVSVLKALNHDDDANWLQQEFSTKGATILAPEPEEMTDFGPLTCILHADCWLVYILNNSIIYLQFKVKIHLLMKRSNNMMYRYDQGQHEMPSEMKLVDWQITRLGHPATDVLHFLLSSTSPELRQEHRRSLIDYYFDQLSSALTKLDLDNNRLDKTRFLEDVNNRLLRAMFNALLIYCVIYDDAMVNEMEKKDCQMSEQEKQEQPTVLDMDQMMKDFEGNFQLHQMLSNQLLCSRIVALVQEVRAALSTP